MTAPLSMSEAFARYCQLYVPDIGTLDTMQFAQLKGAFAAGLTLGSCLAALDGAEAETQVAKWMSEIEDFWAEPRT